MKCDCGHELEEKRGPRKGYGGLADVVVENVLTRSCPHCGETEVGYQDVERLHATIALGLAEKQSPLLPQEIRFLRTYLGLSTDDFATRMGVRRDSVTRWERGGAKPMSPSAEKLLRLMAVRDQPVSAYPLERLDTVATGKPIPVHFRVQRGRGGWRTAS